MTLTLTASPPTSEPTRAPLEPAPFCWTEATVARLRQLWANGRSAAQIAREIGGLSRSAVSAKANRLGLRRPAPGCELPAISAVPRFATTVSELSLAKKVQTQRMLTLDRQQDLREQGHGAPCAESPPASRPCSLLELTPDTCRWPVGDPGTQGFHFCGAQPDTDHVYCAYHRHIAKAPAEEPESEGG
jgi:GcrA cell cycle regulator